MALEKPSNHELALLYLLGELWQLPRRTAQFTAQRIDPFGSFCGDSIYRIKSRYLPKSWSSQRHVACIGYTFAVLRRTLMEGLVQKFV